jgi:hypothetical protein
MRKFAEQSHLARQTSEDVVTDFCGYKKLEIRKLKILY